MMKTIYLRNILSDLWKNKKKTAVFVAVCACAAVFLALRPGTPANLTDEQKEELAVYQQQITDYDTAIRDLTAGIEENQKQADALKNYIDHSIYMQIDPENIQTATVQYGLQTGGNVVNILNSFITYINDGGLRESVAEGDQDLQPEYWRDVIGCYVNNNILSVTVIHSDAEKCRRILEIVKQRIQEHTPEVKAVQGEFLLAELETTQYVKADVGLANNQNNNRNNLKNYETGLADLRTRLINTQTAKADFIENHEPDFASAAEEHPAVRVLKYLLVGILLGVAAAFAAVLLRYILSDRLRSAEDLRDSGLNVLGVCRIKKEESDKTPGQLLRTRFGIRRDKKEENDRSPGSLFREKSWAGKEKKGEYSETMPRLFRSGSGLSKDQKEDVESQSCTSDGESGTCSTVGKESFNSAEFRPEPARAAMDVKALAEACGKDAVYLCLLREDEYCERAGGAYAEALAGEGMSVESGSRPRESADDLRKMINSGACLLVAEAGRTTYRELKEYMELCERFKVAALGCVVVE